MEITLEENENYFINEHGFVFRKLKMGHGKSLSIDERGLIELRCNGKRQTLYIEKIRKKYLGDKTNGSLVQSYYELIEKVCGLEYDDFICFYGNHTLISRILSIEKNKRVAELEINSESLSKKLDVIDSLLELNKPL